MTRSSSDSDHDIAELEKDIRGWLEPDERLHGWTLGELGMYPLGIVVALTSKNVRLGGVEGGRNIDLGEIREIRWSRLWSRLNIRTKSTGEKLVFAVNGRMWKERAQLVADFWDRLSK